MCILFIYNGNGDAECDYRLIVATNRDEYFDRPALNMAPWEGEPHVLAGKDIRGGGTWLALSAVNKKVGVLLNHPVGSTKNAVKSRGKVPIDYVKSHLSAQEYIESMREYFQECAGFFFVSLDFGNEDAKVHSYTKNTDELEEHNQECLGFGNSLPSKPFKKVQAGRLRMLEACRRYRKVAMKDQLVNELIDLLKWEENMCILFIYNGNGDAECDYRLIVATNRDEYFDRPALNMAPWEGEPHVLAGKDIRGGGTWLALSAVNKKVGVLLNHPVGSTKNAVKSRGKVPIDYVKSHLSAQEYIESMREYFQECAGFFFVSLDFGNEDAKVHSYTKNTDELEEHNQECLGFGNSLPSKPFKKVQAGRLRMLEACRRYRKVAMKDQLVNELIDLLKWEEKHLPDEVIEEQYPNNYEQLSSVYVHVPKIYGTRTHTLVLLTKNGDMDVIEVTMQAPIDSLNPTWERTEYQLKV